MAVFVIILALVGGVLVACVTAPMAVIAGIVAGAVLVLAVVAVYGLAAAARTALDRRADRRETPVQGQELRRGDA